VPTNGQDFPNTVLIYNVLNEQWESVDNFPTGIHTLVVANYASRRRLIAVTRTGNLFLMDERADGDDPNDANVPDVVQIEGEMVTRRYQFGVPLPKRFLRCVNSVVLEGGAELETRAKFLDPDSEQVLGTLLNGQAVAEDYSQKASIRRRGAGVELVFRDVAGRTTIRTVAVEALTSEPRMTTLTQQ
jgi:hypothetical protein